MQKFFQEKHIIITDSDGEKLEFFMRPIKVKELQIINRISIMAKSGSDEFTTPIMLKLVIDSLSISGENIPMSASDKLIETYISYNFPELKEMENKEAVKSVSKKKELQSLSFYIDFLVHQGHTVSDVLEMTLFQFNELIEAAANRINPPKKVMDPLQAFRKMGIPIRGNVNHG